ncbi:MAG: hypothetical protein GC165_08225 [Armatimonadetes bacterium]|nr:hypothetical protein [Armatimonadota bacterium]
MNQTSSDYELLRHEGGVFRLENCALVEFDGTEWREWLQGQITNDMRELAENRPISFCLCKPTGQILATGDLHLVDGKGWMIVPAPCVPAILQRVEQMVILEDCTARVLDEPLFHVLLGGKGLPAKRTLWPGHDVVGPCQGRTMSLEVLELASLEASLPLWGLDIDESNFPAEMGPKFEQMVMSYTKGCYTGQEVNHRIHSRGHTNKTWAVYQSLEEMAKGSDLVDTDGNKVGTVTRSALHPQAGWLVGAFAKNGTTPALDRFKP